MTVLEAAVRHFAAELPGGIVHKSFGPNSFTEGGQSKVAYTHRLNPEQLEDPPGRPPARSGRAIG